MDKTLAIIKPDAVSKQKCGRIITMIEEAGFNIFAMKMIRLTREQAASFYEVHKEKVFFNELLDFMTSGNCIVLGLGGKDVITRYRKLMGATDPAQAADNTIRKYYAENKQRNAVHGSDSPENAAREIAFFFD
ncbi:MAG TPA: nucleoside-diphosphate kinase [Spirochaetota bacterium]|nr:nucleoside-diphosphate kinase [Spirochaetota bacterium]